MRQLFHELVNAVLCLIGFAFFFGYLYRELVAHDENSWKALLLATCNFAMVAALKSIDNPSKEKEKK